MSLLLDPFKLSLMARRTAPYLHQLLFCLQSGIVHQYKDTYRTVVQQHTYSSIRTVSVSSYYYMSSYSYICVLILLYMCSTFATSARQSRTCLPLSSVIAEAFKTDAKHFSIFLFLKKQFFFKQQTRSTSLFLLFQCILRTQIQKYMRSEMQWYVDTYATTDRSI